jgi:maleate isomerase
MPIYGRRARIGYTSPPAATEVFPYEFYKIVPEERALELGREVKGLYPDIDTIYFSCPHYAMISAIEPLEHEFGITVVQPLQAIVWHTLRRCGVNDKIEGYGRLLRDF